MNLFDEKVLVDLGEKKELTEFEKVAKEFNNNKTPLSTALLEEKIVKKEPPQEIVNTTGHDLWMVFAVGIFVAGAFSFYALENYVLSPVGFEDGNVLADLDVIKTGLVTLQIQHLCGANLLVEDSNELITNDQGKFVTYSCFVKVSE